MISLFGLIVLGIVGVIIVRSIFGRSGASQSGSVPHPHLKQCPGCSAPLPEYADACPKCGLRVSI